MDLRLGLYQQILNKVAKDKEIELPSKNRVSEIVKSYVRASQDVARKLGGKKHIHNNRINRDIASSAIKISADIITLPQQIFYKKQEKFEKEGKLNKAAGMQALGSLMQNTIGLFAGGRANFLSLGVTSTPLGFITAYSLYNQKEEYLKNNPNSKDFFYANPEDIRKYNELHQTMKAVITRATMGSLALAGIIASFIFDEDTEDGWFDEMMSRLLNTKSGRKLVDRFVPMATAIALYGYYNIDDEKVNTKSKAILEYFENSILNKGYDITQQVRGIINSKKEEDDLLKVGAKIFTNYIGANVDQDEQIIKFSHLIQSMSSDEAVGKVLEDEATTKDMYKQAETAFDVMVISGIMGKVYRANKEGEKLNRYK
jgi:hypothetical protein